MGFKTDLKNLRVSRGMGDTGQEMYRKLVLLSKINVNIHNFSHFEQNFIIGANDDFDNKTTHFDWSLHSNNKGTKIPITGQSAVCFKSEVILSSPSKS